MKPKWLRVGALVALFGVIAAIPASTQVLFGSGSSEGEGDLALLVLVNRMELTAEQMREIHDLLAGLLEERDALALLRTNLEQEMIAFTGTAEELDQILEAYRAEAEAKAEAARERMADAIDQIKGILTVKQGEILEGFLPGLMDAADAMTRLGRRIGQADETEASSEEQDESSGLVRRERILDQLRERLPDAGAIERLRQGLGRFAPEGAVRVAMGAGAARSSVVVRLGGRAVCGPKGLGLEWIERLVRVLELKLEAIG